MQHRQAADARVEHADRPLVHLRDCREGGRRLPSLRAPGPPRRRRRARDAAPASAFSRRTGCRRWTTASRSPSRVHAGRRCAGGRLAGRGSPARPRREPRHGRPDRGGVRGRRLRGARLRRPRARRLRRRGHARRPREVADLRAAPATPSPRGARSAKRSAPGASPTAAVRSGTRSRPARCSPRRRWSRRGRRCTTRSGRRTSPVRDRTGSPPRSRRARRSWPASATTPSRAGTSEPCAPSPLTAPPPPVWARSRRRSTSSRAGRLRLRPHAGHHRLRASPARRSSTRQLRLCALDLPGRGRRVRALESIAWFDRYLKGRERRRREQGRDREARVRHCPRRARRPPARRKQTFVLRGTSTVRGSALVSRRPRRCGGARDLGRRHGPCHCPQAGELSAPRRHRARGQPGRRARRPRAARGRQHRPLANYCVYVPKGTRLRVTVGAGSPAGQVAYLGFAGAGPPRSARSRWPSALARPILG